MPSPTEALHTVLAQPGCPLGVFVPAGLYPPSAEHRALERLASSGTDIFEIGLPHHTPFLDGPVIQSAYRRALRNGNALDRTLRAVEHGAHHAPTVVMAYWEAVTQHGPERLARSLANAGAAGLMVVDLPDQAAETWLETASAHGLTAPRFAPPASTDHQLDAISASASGWLYIPASSARTGYRGHLDLEALSTAARRLRVASPLPLVTGVGISTPARAAAVAPLVDAVVTGTSVVRALERGPDAASTLVAAYARALHPPP